MQPYRELIENILKNGVWKTNRTKYRALTIAGASVEYDCSRRFPMLTLKAVPPKSVFGELSGLLRGATSAAEFRALGCKVWDQNANENEAWLANPFREGEDDLGDIYGAQWRRWDAYKRIRRDHPKHVLLHEKMKKEGWSIVASVGTEGTITDFWYKQIDQIFECYDKIMTNPDDRRILFHGWNPAALNEIALPACHLLYHFIPNKDTKVMDLVMLQRSCDGFLGIPFNVASASALLYFMCKLTGYTPGKFVHHMDDVHLYDNSMEGVEEMLSRTDKMQPYLTIQIPDVKMKHAVKEELITVAFDDLEKAYFNQAGFSRILSELTPDNFILDGYDPHPSIKVDMAV
jgi:thymidylate synthase